MPSNVIERDGRFAARITVRGEELWLGTRATREEAEELVAQARPAAAGGLETVGGWLLRWPAVARVRRRASDETVARTQALAGVLRELGERRLLVSLRRDELVMLASRHPGNARYVSTVLADAVWAGVLRDNPGTGLGGHEAPRPDPPTETQVLELAGAADDPAMRVLTLVCAFSGLRQFEALALEARDVDRRGLLHVRRGKGGVAGWSLLLEPGLSELVGILPDVGRIFPAWDRRQVNHRWLRMRRRCGLEGVRFHDLRHFHATLLVDRGIGELDVAQQLRHRDNGELVRRRYAHPDALAALERIRRSA